MANTFSTPLNDVPTASNSFRRLMYFSIVSFLAPGRDAEMASAAWRILDSIVSYGKSS